MKVTALKIPEVLVIEPKVFRDERGFFLESFNQAHFEKALGYSVHFVQDNHSYSEKNVLRGLHYQIQQPQAKLVRVISGAIFDVAIDLRSQSPTFGHWVAEVLTAENFKQLWIPEGFGHGFLVLSTKAEICYKTTNYWFLEHERCIAWDDKALKIAWPIKNRPLLSLKDQRGALFSEVEVFA